MVVPYGFASDAGRSGEYAMTALSATSSGLTLAGRDRAATGITLEKPSVPVRDVAPIDPPPTEDGMRELRNVLLWLLVPERAFGLVELARRLVDRSVGSILAGLLIAGDGLVKLFLRTSLSPERLRSSARLSALGFQVSSPAPPC